MSVKSVNAVEAAVKAFESKLPTKAKDLKSFFQALGVATPYSEANSNSFLAQYLSTHLIPAVKDIENGLKIDDSSDTVVSNASESLPHIHPNKLINITQSRTLYTLIEMLWLIGLRTTLSLKSRIKDDDTKFPTSLTLPQEILVTMRKCTLKLSLDNVFSITEAIDFIINHDRFAAFMRERNLERILLAYLVMENEWKTLEDHHEHVHRVTSRLEDLLLRSTTHVKAQCVTILRSFLRGDEKIRRRSGEYITQILLSEQGLVAVLQGYLDGLSESPMCSAMQIQLAKSLATVPAHLTTEAYLTNLCQQMIPLWTVALREGDKLLMTSLVYIGTRCTQLHEPSLMETLFYRPLLAPLLTLLTGERVVASASTSASVSASASSSSSAEGDAPVLLATEAVLATRPQVGHALNFLLSFLTHSPPFSFLADTLYRLGIHTIVVQLYLQSHEAIDHAKAPTTTTGASLIHEWANDILRRLLAMKREYIPMLFQQSLFDETRWLGRFRLHADNSIDVVRWDAPVAVTVPSLTSVEAQTSALSISAVVTSTADTNTSTPPTAAAAVDAWLRTQSALLSTLAQWIDLLQSLETYRIEVKKPPAAAPKRPTRPTTATTTNTTNATTTGGQLTNKADEEKPVVIKLEGCVSQCFVRALQLYFACLNEDYTGFSTAPSPSPSDDEDSHHRLTAAAWKRDHRLRTSLIVQTLLEQTSIEQILIDGDTILTLLHTIIQNAAASHQRSSSSSAAPPSSSSSSPSIPLPSTASSVSRGQLPSTRAPLIQVISSSTDADSPSLEAPIITDRSPATADTATSAADDTTALDLTLTILSSLLHFGPKKRSDEEEARLQSMIPDLMQLAAQPPRVITTADNDNDTDTDTTAVNAADEETQALDLAQRAADLALMIFQRRIGAAATAVSSPNGPSASGSGNGGARSGDLDDCVDHFLASVPSDGHSSSSSVGPDVVASLYREALGLIDRIDRERLSNGQPAMRAYGLRHLSMLVAALSTVPVPAASPLSSSSSSTVALVEDVWQRVVASAVVMLRDTDSFVYLNAVLCLKRMLLCSSEVQRQLPTATVAAAAGVGGTSTTVAGEGVSLHVRLSAVLIAAYTSDEALFRNVFAASSSSSSSSSSTSSEIVTESLLAFMARLQRTSSSSTGAGAATAVQVQSTRRWQAMVGEVLVSLLERSRNSGPHTKQKAWLVAFVPAERQLLMGLVAISLRLLRSLAGRSSGRGAIDVDLPVASVTPVTATVASAKKIVPVDLFTGRLSTREDAMDEALDSDDEVDDPATTSDATATTTAAAIAEVILHADDLYLQQSALSVIAEAMPVLQLHGHAYVFDIVDTCVSILRSGHRSSQGSYETELRALRRAAVFLLRYCAEHYLESLLHRDTVHHLTTMAACLETVLLQDRDEVVLFQAEATAAILQDQVAAKIGL